MALNALADLFLKQSEKVGLEGLKCTKFTFCFSSITNSIREVRISYRPLVGFSRVVLQQPWNRKKGVICERKLVHRKTAQMSGLLHPLH